MKILMLSLLLLPLDAHAHQTDVIPTPDMVWLEGVWHVPTPETALLALMARYGARSDPAVAGTAAGVRCTPGGGAGYVSC